MSRTGVPYQKEAFWADDALARLRERFPRWDVWYVLCYPNSVSWCARPIGHPVSTIQREAPDHLASAIEVAEADGSQCEDLATVKSV